MSASPFEPIDGNTERSVFRGDRRDRLDDSSEAGARLRAS